MNDLDIKLKNLEKEKEFEQLESKLKNVMQNEGIDDFNDAFEVTMGVNARPSTSSGVRGNNSVKAVSSAVGNSNTVHNNININNNVAVDSDNKKNNRYNNQGSNFTEDIEDKTNANNNLKTPSVTTSVTTSKKQEQPEPIDDDNLKMPNE